MDIQQILAKPARDRLPSIGIDCVVAHIAKGNSIRSLCQWLKIDSRHFYDFVASDKEYLQKYMNAFFDAADYLEDQSLAMLTKLQDEDKLSTAQTRLAVEISNKLERKANNRRKHGDKRLQAYMMGFTQITGLDEKPSKPQYATVQQQAVHHYQLANKVNEVNKMQQV